MRPSSWHPQLEPSSFEQTIIIRIKRATLFVFLGSLTAKSYLVTRFKKNWRHSTPQVCVGTHLFRRHNWRLSIILQAYTGVSDDEVIEATLMDRRWQLVLDCLDAEQAPWS
jgi:hypothetical protein